MNPVTNQDHYRDDEDVSLRDAMDAIGANDIDKIEINTFVSSLLDAYRNAQPLIQERERRRDQVKAWVDEYTSSFNCDSNALVSISDQIDTKDEELKDLRRSKRLLQTSKDEEIGGLLRSCLEKDIKIQELERKVYEMDDLIAEQRSKDERFIRRLSIEKKDLLRTIASSPLHDINREMELSERNKAMLKRITELNRIGSSIVRQNKKNDVSDKARAPKTPKDCSHKRPTQRQPYEFISNDDSIEDAQRKFAQLDEMYTNNLDVFGSMDDQLKQKKADITKLSADYLQVKKKLDCLKEENRSLQSKVVLLEGRSDPVVLLKTQQMLRESQSLYTKETVLLKSRCLDLEKQNKDILEQQRSWNPRKKSSFGKA